MFLSKNPVYSPIKNADYNAALCQIMNNPLLVLKINALFSCIFSTHMFKNPQQQQEKYKTKNPKYSMFISCKNNLFHQSIQCYWNMFTHIIIFFLHFEGFFSKLKAFFYDLYSYMH